MKRKRGNILVDVLKAVRKANREEEIRLHGKPIKVSNVVESKKVYSRKTKHKNNGIL